MDPNSTAPPNSCRENEEVKDRSTRLLDEKISDDTSTEAKTKSALAPAGLKNPFWK
jgi:hypothetical protein